MTKYSEDEVTYRKADAKEKNKLKLLKRASIDCVKIFKITLNATYKLQRCQFLNLQNSTFTFQKSYFEPQKRIFVHKKQNLYAQNAYF